MERADIKMAIDIVDQFDEPQADHVAYVLIGCSNEITRLRQQVATLTEQRDLALVALGGTVGVCQAFADCSTTAKRAAEDGDRLIAAIRSAEVTK